MSMFRSNADFLAGLGIEVKRVPKKVAHVGVTYSYSDGAQTIAARTIGACEIFDEEKHELKGATEVHQLKDGGALPQWGYTFVSLD